MATEGLSYRTTLAIARQLAASKMRAVRRALPLYVPQNPGLYNAAYSGYVGGVNQARAVTSQVPGDYAGLRAEAVLFAQAVDSAIPADPGLSQADIDLLQVIVSNVLGLKYPMNIDEAGFESTARTIAAIYTETEGGLVPVGPASGGESTEFVYQPMGTAVPGIIFTDPWALVQAIYEADLPCTVYIDCSFQSPAPWPVDEFLPSVVTFVRYPITATPAVIGLVEGTNPASGLPTNGTLLFPGGLDNVGVVNVGGNAPFSMVQGGEIFDSTFTMTNGAYIQRSSDADPIALTILTHTAFDLNITGCPNPFPNLGDASASNTYFGFSDGTLNVRLLDIGPSLILASFNAPAGGTLNLYYDDTIPLSQIEVQSNWTGTFNLLPLAQAASIAAVDTVPLLGSTNVQGQLDALKSRTGGGGAAVAFSFTFETVSPQILAAVDTPDFLTRVSVVMTTAFDDPAASIEVGTMTDPSAVFAAGEVDVQQTGQWDNDDIDAFVALDSFILTIDPGASTQGAGTLYYWLQT